MQVQQIVNLVGGTIVGLALAIFFLLFAGAGQAFAQVYDGTASTTYHDTSPDYVLIIHTNYIYAATITSITFEDEQSCVNAGDAFIDQMAKVSPAFRVATLCASKESAP